MDKLKQKDVNPMLVLALSAVDISEESKKEIQAIFTETIIDTNLIITMAYGIKKMRSKGGKWDKEELKKNYELIWKLIYEEAIKEETIEWALNASTEAFEELEEKKKNDTNTSVSGNC
jgi:hypothetical protein